MEKKKNSNTMRNVALGMAMGVAATTAGAMYINENKLQTKKTIRKVKKNTEKIAKAGETLIRDINM